LIPKILKNIALKNIETVKADAEKLNALLNKDNLTTELLPSEITNGKIINEFTKFVIEADNSKETKETGSCSSFNTILEIFKEKVNNLKSINQSIGSITFNVIEQSTTILEAINYIVLLINYAANIAPNRKSRNLPWVVNIQEKKTQFAEEIKGQVQIVKDYLAELTALVASKKNKGTECIKEIFGSDEALIDNLMDNNSELLNKVFDQCQESWNTSLTNTLKDIESKMKLLNTK